MWRLCLIDVKIGNGSRSLSLGDEGTFRCVWRRKKVELGYGFRLHFG